MSKVWAFLRQNYSYFYKAVLFLISLVILVSFFPKEAKYKYEFTKGRPWLHADLIAPFNFAILKTQEDIDIEKNEILKNRELFFDFDTQLNDQIVSEFLVNFDIFWMVKYGENPENDFLRQTTLEQGQKILSTILKKGVIQSIPEIENRPQDYRISLIIQNTAEKVRLSDLFTIRSAFDKMSEMLINSVDGDKELLRQLLEESISQNIFFNPKVTDAELNQYLEKISTTRGMVQEGERIISKGEVITKIKYQVLESLRSEYENKLGDESNYYLVLAGQVLLVTLSLMVLVFFLYFFRRDILEDNKKVVLISKTKTQLPSFSSISR